MTTVNVSPFGPKPQFELLTGAPAVGNLLFFYMAGSVNTKQNTYTDSTGTATNTNPVILNSLGQPTNQLWFIDGASYKVIYAPSTDTDPPTSPIWTIDNLKGINDSSVVIDQWIISGLTPTFISTTSFTLPSDQTSIFQIGRRIKSVNTSGTIYSRIVSSVFTTLTTITVVSDSGVLDSGISVISYALLSQANYSVPELFARNDNYVTLASATTTPIYASPSQRISISGTTTITAFDSASFAGQAREIKFLGILTLTNSVNLILPGNANITTAAGDTCYAIYEGASVTRIENYTKANGTPVISLPAVQVRQSILAGPVDTSGFSTLFASTATGLAITSQNVTSLAPLIVSGANGVTLFGDADLVGISTINLTWTSLTNTTTNYLYITISALGVLTTGSTTLLPVYQSGGTPSVTTGQATFNTQSMIMYLGNGSAAVPTYLVFVGEAVTSGGNVTSTISYALMRRYLGTYTATLPSPATSVSQSSNIGFTFGVKSWLEIECTTIDNGYAVGDVMPDCLTSNGTVSYALSARRTRNTVEVTTGTNTTNAFIAANKSTGAQVALTNASWKYRLFAVSTW